MRLLENKKVVIADVDCIFRIRKYLNEHDVARSGGELVLIAGVGIGLLDRGLRSLLLLWLLRQATCIKALGRV
jgi:hypothetical protein